MSGRPLVSRVCLAVAGHQGGHVLSYPAQTGLGLLLLRGTVGITTTTQAWLAVSATNTDLLGATVAARGGVCGVALTIGLFTAVSGAGRRGLRPRAVHAIRAAVLPHLDSIAAVIGLAAAAGSDSDPGLLHRCRLFGRREIFIPAKDGSEQLASRLPKRRLPSPIRPGEGSAPLG